ncbi:MAG: SDR family oxidoreductase [Desulfomonile tiedjei]|nr:SDR family oxidoreductase [Desulfomonile tiedjei]
MRFQGKAAIVTGGANGLGKSFAASLTAEGCSVLVADCEETSGEATAEELRSGGAACLFHRTDVTVKAEVIRMAERCLEAFGRIDILINDAGGSMGVPKVPIDQVDEADWDRVVALNLKGTFLCTQAVVPWMKKQQAGKIVNLSSITARVGGELTPVQYVASKGAISTFTRHVAQELGPYGICVNAVAPGIILSGPRLEKMWYERKTEDERRQYVQKIPLKRLGKISEVTDAVLFLCSEQSNYITGLTLDVNGGLFSV